MNNAEVERRLRIDQEKHAIAAQKSFPGIYYLEWLMWLHKTVKPKSYVEIGVESGQSLQFAKSPTKSIGIDPAIQVIHPQQAWVKLFKLASDDFFINYDLREVIGEEFVDLAFIDGLHTFDQALKDFINLEHFSKPDTVIAFHDIYPVTPITASRERQSYFWLGDTWKVVLILKELRPDLNIITIPTYPSGLTLVTRLDCNSTLLTEQLEQTVARWMDVKLSDYIEKMHMHLNTVDNDYLAVSKSLGLHFEDAVLTAPSKDN